MIVVDASAIVEVLLNRASAPRVRERLAAAGETLHAPHLLDLEVTQALRRYSLWGEVSADRALDALGYFRSLRLVRYPHASLLPEYGHCATTRPRTTPPTWRLPRCLPLLL